MISFLKSNPGTPVPDTEIRERYNRLRWHALFGIFIGYAAFYILRNNFLLSSPELISDFGFTKKDIGFISGTMLIVYGLSKGFMSAIKSETLYDFRLNDVGSSKLNDGLQCIILGILIPLCT